MNVVILAGGAGSRLPTDREAKPKPMTEVGGKPILWHIMMHFAHYDFPDFVIALGYKGELIKKYIVDYAALNSDLSVNLRTGRVETEAEYQLDWTVKLVDTGIPTQTGGRLKRLQSHLQDNTFMLTWGTSVSNIDLSDLLTYHKSHDKLATMTVVHPPARYGHLVFEGDRVASFTEKPQTAEGWINGGVFVLEPGIFDYIDGDDTVWEEEPLQQLAADGQLMAYEHTAFWKALDTLRDQHILEQMWERGDTPWAVWE